VGIIIIIIIIITIIITIILTESYRIIKLSNGTVYSGLDSRTHLYKLLT